MALAYDGFMGVSRQEHWQELPIWPGAEGGLLTYIGLGGPPSRL